MNRITRNGILLCLSGFIFVDLFAATQGSSKLNQLNKVFHHKGQERDDNSAHRITLGKVVFYFSRKPEVHPLSQKIKEVEGNKKMVFFFPMTEVKSAECKKMIKQLNAAEDTVYSVNLEVVTKPIKGVKFILTFNPNNVVFEYDAFQSITLQKALVFTFYNKKLLDQLEKKKNAVLQTACNKKPGIVIDCGHGGHDTGAIYFSTKEKDISMEVGLRVAQALRSKGFDVFLTRNNDTDVALDQRTTFANACFPANLFLSIHANSSASAQASGIETFCLDKGLFKKEFSIVDVKDTFVIQRIKDDLYKKGQILAAQLQDTMISTIRKKHTAVVDRKVKYAASQVLLGTSVPSALLELGFLSNKREAALLKDAQYQQLIAQGICRGIECYYKKIA